MLRKTYNDWESLIQDVDFRNKDIADIGCGNGWFIERFLGEARSILAIDRDRSAFNNANTSWAKDLQSKVKFIETNFVQ